MIFATVGTLGFDRLVAAVDSFAAVSEEPVTIQLGSSLIEPVHAQWFRFATPSRIDQLICEASVVIAHAGAGTLLTVLDHGKPLCVMPRLKRLHEHIDDHQIELCDVLEQAGALVVIRDDLAASVTAARALVAGPQVDTGRERLTAAVRSAISDR